MFAFLRRAYVKAKLGPPVVLVSGLPRSGTSMMMKMLDAGGLEVVTDQVRTADEDNPRGYFEYERVKELDKPGDKSWVREHRGKVVKIISFLLQDLPPDNYYKIVFMRRNLHEIIASQNKMLVRRGESGGETDDERMIELYKGHIAKVKAMSRFRINIELLDVKYRQVIENPRQSAVRVAEFVGMNLDPEKMSAAVDGQLYRNRRES